MVTPAIVTLLMHKESESSSPMVEQFYELLQFAFFQRALGVGVLLAILAGLVGVFSTVRKSSFFGDAIAHSALAGVALGLFFEVNPLLTASVYAVLLAVALPWLKKNTGFSFDSLLALFLPVSMGAGVIIFSALPGYQPNLLSFLFGNMLAITNQDMYFLLLIVALVLGTGVFFFRQFLLVSLDEDQARLLGIRVSILEFVYHFILALTVVAGVRLVGVVLVNAFLIIPPLIVGIHVRSLKQLFIFTPVISLITVLGGMIASVALNAPTGASIAVFAGALFVVSLLVKKGTE